MLINYQYLTTGLLRNLASSKTYGTLNGTYALNSSDGKEISSATGSAPDGASSNASLSINNYLGHYSQKNYGNTSLGAYSQYYHNEGAGNTSTGWYAMHKITDGCGNVCSGWFSMYNLTTGNLNIAIGTGSGYNNNGEDNSFIGSNSGYYNIGNENAFLGSNSGHYNTGNNNVLIGFNSGYRSNSSNNNVFIGNESGHYNTGNDSVSIGNHAGYYNAGNNNIFIGKNTDYLIPNVNNSVHIGDGYINLLRCSTYSISTNADERDKKDILPLPFGLKFLKLLNPVMFKWNKRDGTKIDIQSCGLIAQKVKDVVGSLDVNGLPITPGAPSSNDVLNLLNELDPNNLELIYGNLIPVIVNSINQINTDHSNQLSDLTESIRVLTSRLTTANNNAEVANTEILNLKNTVAAMQQTLNNLII